MCRNMQACFYFMAPLVAAVLFAACLRLGILAYSYNFNDKTEYQIGKILKYTDLLSHIYMHAVLAVVVKGY